MAPLAAIANKEMVNAAFEMGLAQGINFERRLFHGLFGTEDQKEGMAAFVEKRPGNWTGVVTLRHCEEPATKQSIGAKLIASLARNDEEYNHGTRRIHRAGAYGRRHGAEPRQGGP